MELNGYYHQKRKYKLFVGRRKYHEIVSATMSGNEDAGILAKIQRGDAEGVTKINKKKESKSLLQQASSLFPGKKKKQTIGTPYAVQQLSHVGYDKSTGQFVGLPAEWKVRLGTAGISSNEIEANPEAVLQALEFQDRYLKNEGVVAPPPSNAIRRLNVGGGQQAPAPPPVPCNIYF